MMCGEVATYREGVLRGNFRLGRGRQEVPRDAIEPEILRQGCSSKLVGLRSIALALGGAEVGGEFAHGIIEGNLSSIGNAKTPAGHLAVNIFRSEIGMLKDNVIMRPTVTMKLNNAKVTEAG
jgi:hypothetical protein